VGFGRQTLATTEIQRMTEAIINLQALLVKSFQYPPWDISKVAVWSVGGRGKMDIAFMRPRAVK
jgi:hypothetical protein